METDHATWTVTSLGRKGDGICEGSGGARAFARGVLPGEVVAGKAKDAWIPRPRILTPSPDRVRAPCPHAGSCGGCDLQHASDRFVSEWKRAEVVRALHRAGISDVPVAIAHVSPAASRRRAGLAGVRTKKGALVGFHGRRSGVVVPVPSCAVLDPALLATLPALEALTLALASRRSVLTLDVTLAQNGVDVAVAGAPAGRDGPLDPGMVARLQAAGIIRLTVEGEVAMQVARPVVILGGVTVEPPPASFLQATPQAEGAMQDLVADAVGGAARIADLFCGVGTFTLPLARRAEMLAADAGGDMLAALGSALDHAQGLRPVAVVERDLFRDPFDGSELTGVEAVVIDPPRAGAAAQSVALARSAVPVIAAVSCNPWTFARDAAVLIGGGYRLERVAVIDQFRWSAHIELVARFSRG